MPVSNNSVLVDRSVSGGRFAMNRPVIVGVDGAAAVDRVADQIEHPAEGRLADRHLDGAAGVEAFLAANHAVGAAQRHAADAAAAKVLLHFADEVHLDPLVLRLDA